MQKCFLFLDFLTGRFAVGKFPPFCECFGESALKGRKKWKKLQITN
jgi:hypothetical protein